MSVPEKALPLHSHSGECSGEYLDKGPSGGMVDALVSGASVERRASSILVLGTLTKRKRQHIAEIAQLVEHDLAKVGVASSSLVFRSKEFGRLPDSFFVPDPNLLHYLFGHVIQKYYFCTLNQLD